MTLAHPYRCLALPILSALTLLLVGCPPPAAPPAEQVALQVFAEGFTLPVGLTPLPDASSRVVVVDLTGKASLLDSSGSRLNDTFLDLRSSNVPLSPLYDERGLLSVAFHPNFQKNRRLFAFYVAPWSDLAPVDFNSEIHVSEFIAAQDLSSVDVASERLLLRIAKPQSNHNGGQLAFGPDGFLYASVGDGGGGNDVGFGHTAGLGNGQDRTQLLGKILRIDVDSGDPYAIPADNPFVDDPNARPEIWALGFRNPWRMSFDVGVPSRLFAGDAGQNLIEEIDLVTRGGNFGWNIREGSACFDPTDAGTSLPACATTGANGEPLLEPIVSYSHFDGAVAVGQAVIGGYVYRGDLVPGLSGQYVFGDFSRPGTLADGVLFAATESSGAWTARTLGVSSSDTGRLDRYLLGFGQDLRGEVYALTSLNAGPTGATGIVYKIATGP